MVIYFFTLFSIIIYITRPVNLFCAEDPLNIQPERTVRDEKIKTFSVPAEAAHLPRIRDFAIKYGEKFGFNMRQLNGYKLSLDEICTNIIRYAYEGMERGDVRFEIIKQKEKVITRITDSGVAFDYNTVLNPDLDRYVREKRKGGFGIYLVRQLNDEVRYERIGNTNVLTLVNTVEPKPTLIDQVKRNFKPSGMTIRVRFTVVASLIISCITVGTFFIATLSQKRTFKRQAIGGYVAVAKGFASTTAEYILSERDLLITEQIFKMVEDEPAIVRLTVIDRNGVVTADKTVTNIGTLYIPPAGVASLIEQEQLIDEYMDPEYKSCVYIAVPIRISNMVIGKVFLSIEEDAVEKAVAVRMNRARIVLYMIVFWIIGIVGISFMGNMFVTPIKKITEEINRVGKEGTAGSFHFAGFGEFAEISTAFNKMMREIKQSQVRLTDQARLKREMQLAQNIQQTLLPRQVPESEGFEIAAKYNAAMEVGGDYYDFFYVDEHSIGIVVGDVSGKGVGGAFVMSIVRTALRLEARGNKNASEVLKKLNATLDGEFKKGMYITLFYVILDSKKRVVNYASAGHTPMILYRSETNLLYKLNPKGFPIGLNLGDGRVFRKNITNEKVSLSRGDLLFVYTDGITEAMNTDREEFGEDRLMSFIREHRELSVNAFSQQLVDEIKNFTRGHPQNDDITFVVIQEKKKYDELEYEKRLKLFDLIEKRGVSVAEACKQADISRSSYYKLKKLRDEQGVEAIMPETENREIAVLDFEISRKILIVIADHPEYSAVKIAQALAFQQYGELEVKPTLVHRELRRLKLSTKERRMAYVKRKATVVKGQGRR